MAKNGKPRKKRLKKIILLLLLLMILALAGFIGMDMLRQKYTVTYEGYTATTGSISNALSFSGNMSLINSATYASPSASTVRTVYVKPGDKVKDGDSLIRLANGSIIKSEIDGTVNTISVSEGDKVTSGQTLAQIADFEHMKVNMRVDEYDIGSISIGQSCTVTVTSNEHRYRSQVAAIDRVSASTGNVAYYTATVYVDVNDGDTLPGMQVSVSIPKEEATNVVILKADALSFDERNQAYVWVKDAEGNLARKYVKTGVSNGNYVEITEGLNSGDEIFTEVKKAESSALNGLLSGLFSRQNYSSSSRNTNRNNYGANSGFTNFGGNTNRQNGGTSR